MAADWVTFITKVGNKLGSQSIKSYDEMADFLKNEYISATVGKAASPYGQIHVKGKDKVMLDGFKKGFKMLYEKGDLSFEDKKTNPEYADLEVQPPTIDVSESADQVELDFRDWVDENAATIPPFVYSQFFSQYPNFPIDRKQAVVEIARKILHQFDGTSSYLQWMFSLRTGPYSDWGNLIMDEVVKLLNVEVSRPIQPGDTVRGFAKYQSKTNINTYYSPDSFNDTKGDVNVDNTEQYSYTYENNIDREVKVNSRGDYVDVDYVEGKIVSISGEGGTEIVKASYFSKKYNRTFIRELIPGTINRKIALKDISDNLPAVNISDRLFQDQHLSNPNKIPDYLTARFITRFTYSKYDGGYLRELLRSQNFSDSAINQVESEFNDNYQYATEIAGLFSNNRKKGIFGSKYSNNFNSIFRSNTFNYRWINQQYYFKKINQYAAEETRFRELKIRWINELAESAKKVSDPDKPEDPYDVMAKGVLDYWKSCAQQPLSKEPAAPPCVISLPQGGLYVPVYYGSQKTLGNNMRRAFNTGKRFNEIYEKPIASKLVASALAYSFSVHLLELKFVYRGGIPGPNGPVPMLGFVPLVY
jgi:hypothetical protein